MIAASVLPQTSGSATARDTGRLASSEPGFRRDLSQALDTTRPDPAQSQPAPADHRDDHPIETDQAAPEQVDETIDAPQVEASPDSDPLAGSDRQQSETKDAAVRTATVPDAAKPTPQPEAEVLKPLATGSNDQTSVLLAGSESQTGKNSGGGGGDPLKILVQAAALKAGAAAALMPVSPTADASTAQVASLAPTASPSATSSTPGATSAAPPGAAFQAEQTGVDPNVARVARGLQSALNQQGGSVSLRLHPPELGMVRLEMEINGGKVSARLIAEHESVRTLLNQQLNHLRQALRSQGLVVERLEVLTQPPTSGSEAEPQSWRDNTDDGRSRGRHSFFKSHSDEQATNDRSATDPLNFEQVLLNMVG